MVGVFKETGSGVRLDRAERRKVMALAQARQIDAVLVTELSRWGRSTTDLLATLKELEARRVSVVALNGMTFDLATPHGRMMATVLAGIAEFERELIQERIRSGIAAAKARGKRLGRQPGQRPKSDRLASKVLALVGQGTQLSLDRARSGAEQEYRRRYRQTSPRQGNSDRLTATLRLVTRMLGLGQVCRRIARRRYLDGTPPAPCCAQLSRNCNRAGSGSDHHKGDRESVTTGQRRTMDFFLVNRVEVREEPT